MADEAGGWRLEEIAHVLDEPVAPRDVPSVLDRPPSRDVSIHWIVEGWPRDVERAINSFRAIRGERSVQSVVVDVSGGDLGELGESVEVIRLPAGTGWAAARNAGLKRSMGRTIWVMDGSIEATGDVFGPVEAALADPQVGIAGPFGLVTHDLREFEEVLRPGACDAIQGYVMAMRREVLTAVGLFDEKFTWYRSADLDYSFRVKDLGLRTVVVPVPVTRHQHRVWTTTEPAERERRSKRNFYRFLDRWRDRWDLVLEGEPSGSGTPKPEG